jgi:hypothetical protein
MFRIHNTACNTGRKSFFGGSHFHCVCSHIQRHLKTSLLHAAEAKRPKISKYIPRSKRFEPYTARFLMQDHRKSWLSTHWRKITEGSAFTFYLFQPIGYILGSEHEQVPNSQRYPCTGCFFYNVDLYP